MVATLKRKRTGEESAAVPAATENKITKTKAAAAAPVVARGPDRDFLAETVPGPDEMGPQLQRIAASGRTAFEKRVWTLLCQIPPGRVSTYGIVSAHLGSSPRAVGNALRRNPFAPQVPCHRVVATGGRLGGFKGHWPRDGEGITITEKSKLLRREGVKIDPSGKVLGTPFSSFA